MMEKIIIDEGRRRPSLLNRTLSLVRNRKRWSQTAMFTNDTCYTLDGEDQWDWNKLGGFSLGLNHHKNSMRWAWRYANGIFEVSPYIYASGSLSYAGQSGIVPVTVDARKKYEYVISVARDRVRFMVINAEGDLISDQTVAYQRKDGYWSLGLGAYFGGNRKAPRTISFYRE